MLTSRYGQEQFKADWASDTTATEMNTLLANEEIRFTRGITDHEHMNRTGFIHMNGRTCDPRLGRFMQADIVVQGNPAGLRTVGRQFRKCESVDALADDIEAVNCPLFKLQPAMEWTSLNHCLAHRKSDHR